MLPGALSRKPRLLRHVPDLIDACEISCARNPSVHATLRARFQEIQAAHGVDGRGRGLGQGGFLKDDSGGIATSSPFFSAK